VRLDRGSVPSFAEYPFSIPAVAALDELALDPRVTVLVGDNGSGKSTLLEAIAVAAGMNAEGGGHNFHFATRASESPLHEHLRLSWRDRPRTDFFLRAESLSNLASELERLDEEDGAALIPYGGRSLHDQSHGESFLALALNRFVPGGLYLLDEPESALSPTGQLALLELMHELAEGGAQFIVATHSPILMAVPGALILHATAGGLRPVSYDAVETVALYRSFLADPGRFLHHLLADSG
jgi:predicted ATPase